LGYILGDFAQAPSGRTAPDSDIEQELWGSRFLATSLATGSEISYPGI
jgi:hypothetical protein